MNRERAKELLPIIQAFIDGKQIQCRGKGANHTAEWINLDDPNWDYRSEYRVAPEVFKVIGYGVCYCGSYNLASVFIRKEAAEDYIKYKTVPTDWAIVELEGSYER